MNHHYRAVKYYPGIEDGYAEYKTSKLKKIHKIRPFIYDRDGNKQFIFENDIIIISDGFKTIKNKFEKYLN